MRYGILDFKIILSFPFFYIRISFSTIIHNSILTFASKLLSLSLASTIMLSETTLRNGDGAVFCKRDIYETENMNVDFNRTPKFNTNTLFHFLCRLRCGIWSGRIYKLNSNEHTISMPGYIIAYNFRIAL